jgi:hypothetical protein
VAGGVGVSVRAGVFEDVGVRVSVGVGLASACTVGGAGFTLARDGVLSKDAGVGC